MREITFGLLLAVSSCGASEDVWVERLAPQLRCGMATEELQALVDRPIEQTTNKPELGSHRVGDKRSDLWLTFQENRLVSVISGRVDGLTSVRLSPKRNLCTRRSTFFLSVEWVMPLEGASIFLDGKSVEENASSGLILEVSEGDHELRVVKEGYEPIVKYLHFEDVDQGRYDLLLTSTDLRPTSSTGN